MNDEKLISLVQNYSFLYDKTNPSFKQKDAKDDAWKAILEEMQTPADVCMRRWCSLRERFSREVKGYTPSGSGNDGIAPWHLYSAMSFIYPHIKPRRTRCSSNVFVKGSPEVITAEWEVLQEQFSSFINEPEPSTSSKQKQKRKDDAVGHAILEALDNFNTVCQKESQSKNLVIEGFGQMIKALIEEMSTSKQNKAMRELTDLAWAIKEESEN